VNRLLLLLSIVLLFILNTPIPAKETFNFKMSAISLKQGDTLKITLWSNKKILKCKAFLHKRKFKGFQKKNKNKHHFNLFIGISKIIKPGVYPIKIHITLVSGKIFIKTLHIKIKDAKFKKSVINIKGKKKHLVNNSSLLKKESILISNYFSHLTPQPYFFKPFIHPTRGRISSPFGTNRLYNLKRSKKHSGVDIANVIHTKIVAANNGKIIMSQSLKSHGETIMIDHGIGILTIYNHLKKRVVKKGYIVKRGQIIGTMGMSGIATGPHLHWGMSIQNVRINPEFWLENLSLYE